jgi:iron complex outermembrane recepter protein
MTPSPIPCFGAARLLQLLLTLVLVVAGYASEPVKKSFDIPSDTAPRALKQFAAQSGEQLLFSPSEVADVKTLAVKGLLTSREALERMLEGTTLVVAQDKSSGALAVRKETGAESKNGPSRRADVQAAVTSGDESVGRKVQAGIVKLQSFEVTGSRIRGLVEGATAQPVLSLSAADIERTGAQSLGDVFRYIPQVSSFSTGQQVNNPTMALVISGGRIVSSARSTNMTGSAGRVSASLRGASADGTLLLVNGRRVPKNNQSAGGDGYDLNGIPLAAIERIDVLLDGASSVYGADAQGGVINVILKREYSGTEVRLSYENTFDKDAGVFSGSILQGFAQQKWRGIVSVNWEEANAMALRDRDFTRSYDRRPFGGIDLRRSTLASGAGSVSRTGTVPLPGLTTTSAAIPPGTTGVGLTAADYAAAGAVPPPLNLAEFQDYSSTYRRRSATFNLSYEHASWLEGYAEGRLGENKNYNSIEPIQAVGLSIPAGYPGNPFGIPISLSKAFYDVMPERVAVNKSNAFTLGLRGLGTNNWRYDLSVSRVSGHTQSDAEAGTAITQARFNAAIAAGQQPNLFYDSTTRANPNAPGALEALTDIVTDEEIARTWTYALHGDGPVFNLPAGEVRVAIGSEWREESVQFPRRLATDTFSALPASREVLGIFAEANVPVFSPTQRLPLLHQLNVSGAFRREQYSSSDTRADNPRLGVAWRPVEWLLLRASKGEGLKMPTLRQTNGPVLVQTNVVGFPNPPDPLRGGELVSQPVPITNGGNPSLRPERVDNTSAGVMIDVPGIRGLSLSFDYFDNEFSDKIGSLSFLDRVRLFPQTISRGPNLPSDPAGWAGRVTAVDARPVNVAYSRVSGYDLGLRYNRRLGWGEVSASVVLSNYSRNESYAVAGATIQTTVSPELLPTMLSGSLFVRDGAWSTGVLASYRSSSKPLITTAFVVTDTPSAIRWDWQGSYDFSKAAWLKNARYAGLRRALEDTKLGLTIFNVLNTRPPFNYDYIPDNTIIDSRLRRYAISVRRSF